MLEIQSMLGSNFELFLPFDLGITGEPDENFETLKENALSKARFYREKSGLPTLAEDTGLFVEALGGEPGVKTRRWGAGAKASDEEWLAYFLRAMDGKTNRRAKFECYAAFIDENGTEHTFHGECPGVITETKEHAFVPGLPVGSCFRPDGYDAVFEALPREEKNKISHRGQAIKKFLKFKNSPHDKRDI